MSKPKFKFMAGFMNISSEISSDPLCKDENSRVTTEKNALNSVVQSNMNQKSMLTKKLSLCRKLKLSI